MPGLLLLLSVLPVPAPQSGADPLPQLQHPDYRKVEVSGPVWGRRIRTNAERTLDACLEQCDETGRIRNFEIASGHAEGKFSGYFFNDSDVYKVLEGAAYVLGHERDAELEARIDAIIAKIAAAQHEDGYLNSYFTLTPNEKRWANTRVRHELYCAGHLIEAGIAYHEATGKRKLLDVAIRFVDCIDEAFGPDKNTAPPGHQEIELALFRLADHTGEQRFAKLGEFFLETRGRGRDGRRYGEYSQDHAPIREQRSAVGHAVRAMYMYSAMADLAVRNGDRSLVNVLDVLWHDVTNGKMYVTGAIGAEASHEGFAEPFELPNDDAYCESCASVGLAMWADRMFSVHRDSSHVDVMERVLYNGLLSGISLTGDRFLYVNPLASRGKHERKKWYACACCPTNFVRFLPKIAERIYAYDDDDIYVNLYEQSRTRLRVAGQQVGIEQRTEYPWQGAVRIRLTLASPARFALRLRRPGWCKQDAALQLNGRAIDEPRIDRGYLTLDREWRDGDTVDLTLPMPVRRVRSDPRVAANIGRVALARGPLVYCIEAVDNGGHARNFVLKPGKLRAVWRDQLLGGTMVVEADALRRTVSGDFEDTKLSAIPYELWGHRGRGEMVVWVPERRELAERPGEGQRVTHGELVLTASHCYRGDTVTALVDGKLPDSSGDHSLPRMTWWPEKGGKSAKAQWVGVELEAARRVSKTSVYWFDDRDRNGGCRVPRSWQLVYRDDKTWKPVKPVAGQSFSVALDRLNEVSFQPIEAREFRLLVELRADYSGGVLEWKLE